MHADKCIGFGTSPAPARTWHVFVIVDRVCTHYGGIAVADELHMIHECPVLQPLMLEYAALFTPDTNTMRSFFAQQDHMQVFKFVLDCLDFLIL